MQRKLKNIFVFTLFVLCVKLNAQNTKGFTIEKQELPKAQGKTFALIMGVSKYKDTKIPSLEFADRDAIAFYDYLISTGVDNNNITLLTNENASSKKFWAQMHLLKDMCKSGDKALIYFSGHGDVESETITKDAFLLPYDAPNQDYSSGSAIGVYYLKSWLATLSSKNIEVVFITDACHAGNLSGGREGMQMAANVLKENWGDETKILSCEPDEVSLEGKQWGNGRGVFSYVLINGLVGLADNNNDGEVTLSELNIYLLTNVEEETMMSQNPVVIGKKSKIIAHVDEKLKSKLIAQDPNLLRILAEKEQKRLALKH